MHSDSLQVIVVLELTEDWPDAMVCVQVNVFESDGVSVVGNGNVFCDLRLDLLSFPDGIFNVHLQIGHHGNCLFEFAHHSCV